MQINEASLGWLKKKFEIDIITEAWIFGSAVRSGDSYRDVDVFVLYRDGYARHIAGLRRTVEADFRGLFGIPLHLLALSEMEREQSLPFLEKALCGAVRIV
jgi:predicted nucleotidyltransferase